MNHPVALRAMPERPVTCGRAINDNNALRHISLYNLCDAAGAPKTQVGTTRPRCLHGITEGLAHGPQRGTQPIGTEQEWAIQRLGMHARDEAPDHRQVAMRADLTRKLQPHPDHHCRHCPLVKPKTVIEAHWSLWNAYGSGTISI